MRKLAAQMVWAISSGIHEQPVSIGSIEPAGRCHADAKMTTSKDFSEIDFSPRSHVNDLLAAYQSAPDGITLEQYLLDAEMRVYVQAGPLSSEVRDLRDSCTVDLPRAVRQLTQIKEEVGLLNVAIECAMNSLVLGEGSDAGRRGAIVPSTSSTTVGILDELQQLKEQRDLHLKAKTMLEEASNLSSLFKTIDSMLQSDDLTRLADSLARFRTGLEIVSVSGMSKTSSSQRNKVDQLEERVFDLAVKALDSSLRLQNGDQCRRACGILRQIDRAGLIGQRYSTIRSQPLMELWESYNSTGPYSSWVGTFYEELGRAVGGEISWCRAYLGDFGTTGQKMGFESNSLTVDMLRAFFGRIEVPCKARLAGATRGGLSGIEAMEQVAGCTGGFVDTLVGILIKDEEHGVEEGARERVERIDELVRVIIGPYDDMLRNYAEKEGVWFKEEAEKRLRNQVKGGGVDDALIDDLYACVLESLQRCQSTTQSTALPELLELVDGTLAAFCERAVDKMMGYYTLEVAQRELSGLLALPRLTEKMQRVLVTGIATQVREQVEGLQAGLVAFREWKDGQQSLDLPGFSGTASLNYRRAVGSDHVSRSIAGLFVHATATPDTKHQWLPKLCQALERARCEVQSLVVKTFSDVVRVHFQELDKGLSPEALARSISHGAVVYPLQYVVSAGEQLMLLPHLLESALEFDGLSTSSSAGDVDLVGVWLERLARAACTVYLEQLSSLNSLDTLQSRQLAADCDYLCNILNSLDCEAPIELMAWMAVLSSDDEGSALAIAESLGGEAAALKVAKEVIDKRFGR